MSDSSDEYLEVEQKQGRIPRKLILALPILLLLATATWSFTQIQSLKKELSALEDLTLGDFYTSYSSLASRIDDLEYELRSLEDDTIGYGYYERDLASRIDDLEYELSSLEDDTIGYGYYGFGPSLADRIEDLEACTSDIGDILDNRYVSYVDC